MAKISGRERWQRFQHSCHMIQGQMPRTGLSNFSIYIIFYRSFWSMLYLVSWGSCLQQKACWCNFIEVMMSNTHQLYGWVWECFHTMSKIQGLQPWKSLGQSLDLALFRFYLTHFEQQLFPFIILFSVHSFVPLQQRRDISKCIMKEEVDTFQWP